MEYKIEDKRVQGVLRDINCLTIKKLVINIT